MQNSVKKAGAFFPFYLLAFVFTLHVASTAYINSTFLSGKIGGGSVGLVYAGASFITLIAFFFIGSLLKKRGDYDLTLTLMALDFFATVGLAALKHPYAIIAAFAVNFITVSLIAFDFDLLLESFSKNSRTGTLRGNYLTVANLAWIAAPAIAGLALKNGDYWRIYLISLIFLLVAFIVFRKFFRGFEDPKYKALPFFSTLRAIVRKRNIRLIFGASFILQFFFAVMVIYTPLYLHDYIGFGWQDIGIMFSIMLLPFLFLEGPLGRIADRFLGEKEFLAAGFVITAVTTALIAFLREPSFILWTSVLFATRVGASMIEVMSETYFFKKINADDADIVAFFRAVRPSAYVVAPAFATLLLSFISLAHLFLALAVIILAGLAFTIPLKDTK